MQFMYLRRKGSKKNPGNHPYAMIGAQSLDAHTIGISVISCHSEDRFVKATGRRLLAEKVPELKISAYSCPALNMFLKGRLYKRIDDKARAQRILENLLADVRNDYHQKHQVTYPDNGCAP